MRPVLLFTALPLAAAAAPEFDDVSAVLAGILGERDGVPALAAAAVHKGELVAAGASGLRKIGRPEQVTLADRFHLGSCTKSMTATLAAILVREGAITWETGPEDVLERVDLHPKFAGVTLEQLLSNTGGGPKRPPAGLWRQAWEGRGAPQRQRLEFARGILQAPPAYAPGEGYAYSNAGFAIAGAMLEAAAGDPYEDLLAEKLFKPLGMTSAGFRAPGKNGMVAQPFGHNPGPVDPEPRGDNPRAIAPAGAVHCTVTDWAKYAALHLGHGPPGLLDRQERSFLHKPRGNKDAYALGWVPARKDWAGGPCLWHNGSNTMWYAWIWLAPEREFAAMAVTNIGRKTGEPAVEDALDALIDRYLPKN
ncbi:MAG: beta-lactamase family protein [Akkermansiaceae bacterium]|nr:beta-lactamase family protein [Akkermansiaceae bacterium]